MTLRKEKFNKDYFENGVEKGISLYENFRWMPEVSLPLANFIKQKYTKKITPDGSRYDKVLDYGCAKGFLVHALRLLDVTAYGFDTSNYALKNCHPEVKKYLFGQRELIPQIDTIIVKDVLEHFTEELLDKELKWMHDNCHQMLVVVPLGENNKYRIPEYGFDKTHILKENEDWWINKFRINRFTIDEFYYKIDCIKRNWHNHHDYGNAIFFLRRK